MLLILESPSKCSTVSKFLDCKCIATCGHLQTLESVSDDFAPKYKTNQKQYKYLAPIIASYKQSDIFLACDCDREGEAICAQICDLFGLDIRTTKRIKFHEITKSALEDAVANPTVVDLNLVAAQRARQIIDWTVGFKVSPVLWKHVSSDTALSAGRCQTPALRLVYENQMEIDNDGVQTPEFTIFGMFHKTQYTLNHKFTDSNSVYDFLEKTISWNHVYDREEPRQVVVSAPKPFTTSRLQQSASNTLKFSPKDTMTIAQTLYERGLITYMRTDSDEYSHEFMQAAISYITNNYGDQYTVAISPDKQCVKAHEAIRVTDISLPELNSEWSSREKRLYKLIWTNTIESCMPSAIYSSTKQTITASNDKLFVNVHDVLIFPGFKIVRGEKPIKPAKVLSKLQTVKYESVYSDVKINKKSHYSEARLVNLLEERGIGRPSTFASLVDKIQERKYAIVSDIAPKMACFDDYSLSGDGRINRTIHYINYGQEKRVLQIQPIGKQVSEFLQTRYPSLFDYDFTREMEADLDMVSLGIVKPEALYGRIAVLLGMNDVVDDVVGNGLKKGKYGLYTVVDGKNVSVKGFGNRPMENITQEEVLSKLKKSNVLREVSAKLSIRTSKRGDYIFYSTGKVPIFYSLDGFPSDYLTCELSELSKWIKDKYGKY